MDGRVTADRGGVSRRAVLAAAGAGALGTAGCLGTGASTRGEGDGGDGDPVVVASFFTFFDFARTVAADTPVRVENLVPVGLHGHGWEPDPSITRDIVDADGFVHVGEGFQPWADRAIRTVRDDDADTRLINAREGVDLLDLASGLDDDEEVADGKDPHFWLDPTRAAVAIDNVEAGLVEIAPDHAETLRANADALRADLDALDGAWRDLFERGERDVVFLAAHNAFQYVGERYGASVRPLVTNLAATDDVRPEDVRRAQETIGRNGIRYIGAAVFEPRRPAQQLLAETAVEAYFPVTPYAGTTEAWAERDWGYFDIARNINMPTFRILLGAAAPDEVGDGFDGHWRNFD